MTSPDHDSTIHAGMFNYGVLLTIDRPTMLTEVHLLIVFSLPTHKFLLISRSGIQVFLADINK